MKVKHGKSRSYNYVHNGQTGKNEMRSKIVFSLVLNNMRKMKASSATITLSHEFCFTKLIAQSV